MEGSLTLDALGFTDTEHDSVVCASVPKNLRKQQQTPYFTS